MAPIPITRAEYEAKFGAPSTESTGPIPISRADYAARFGPAKEDPSFLDSVWEGVKGTPRAAVDLVSSIPSGASNLFSSIFSPVKSLHDGTLERTARGTGTIASGVAGAGVGAMAGVPLAPFTFGASIPVGGAIGGAAGMLGFDWLNQATGSDEGTTPEEDLQSLGRNTGTGLGLGVAAKGVKAAAGKVADAAPKIAENLDRKSLQTRQSDYGKASDTRTIEAPDGSVQTYVKSSLNDLLNEGKLGKSRDPGKLLTKIDLESRALSSAIDKTIKSFDESGGKAKPDFDGALQYLESGKVPADLVPSYLNRLGQIESAINSEGRGSLGYLQQQKIAFGKAWDPADAVKSGFDRAIYSDLKNSIEKYVPEVKKLNAELGKYKTVEPIINRSLKASENASFLTKLRDIGYTTGGIGAPTIAGTMMGGPAGALAGAALGLGGKFIATPGGQAKTARALRKVGKAARPIATIADSLFTPSKVGAQAVSNAERVTPSRAVRKPAEDLETIMDGLFSPAHASQQKEDIFNMDLEKALDIQVRPTSGGGGRPGAELMSSLFSKVASPNGKMSREEYERNAREGSRDFQSKAELAVMVGMQRDGLSEEAAKDKAYRDHVSGKTESISKMKSQLPMFNKERNEMPSKDIKAKVERLKSAVINQESGGDPYAVSTENEYMKKKGTGTAKGMFQLLDATGEELFNKYKKELPEEAKTPTYNPFNADQNEYLGKKYLEELLTKYKGDEKLALTAYHTGMGNVDKLLKKHNATTLEEIRPYLGKVGQKYAMSILKKADKNSGLA
jgi:hypothetical protein